MTQQTLDRFVYTSMQRRISLVPAMTLKINPVFKFIIPITIFVLVIVICVSVEGSQQFSYLANSFLHGHTYFLNGSNTPGGDLVDYNGKFYWALGPLPAIVLMPFVGLFSILNHFFYQGYLQVLLILALAYILIKIARKLSYSIDDSVLLCLAFILGSMFIGVASVSTSWYFAQVLTTLLLFFGIYKFLTGRHWWAIGISIALVAITRLTAATIVIFFLLEIWDKKQNQTTKLKDTTKLLLPLAIAMVLLMTYNYVRFGNVLEQGYGLQILVPSLTKARAYGIFSPIHLPGNIFYAFFSGPVPVFRDSVSHVLKFPFIKSNPWGMSIFLTSPYLLYLFTIKRSQLNRRTIHILITVAITAALVFLYYGIGFRQFGYRYALDFMPLVYLLFIMKYREAHNRLTMGMKTLLITSFVLNIYLLLT